MRRYMMRIAEHFAKKCGCLGLITGESIGQVASQTLQIFVAKHPVTKPNLNVIHRSETKLEEKIDQLMEEALSTVEVIEIN